MPGVRFHGLFGFIANWPPPIVRACIIERNSSLNSEMRCSLFLTGNFCFCLSDHDALRHVIMHFFISFPFSCIT